MLHIFIYFYFNRTIPGFLCKHCTKKNNNNTAIYVVDAKTFFFLHCPLFYEACIGQHLEIKPTHFTVFHHLHHFAGVKSQAIPSKTLNVIGPSSSRSSNWSFPIRLASKACLRSLSRGICLFGQTI